MNPAGAAAIALASAIGWWIPAAGAAPTARLWGPLEPGPHAVGFRVLAARDETRRLAGTGHARPIQISVWYPAAVAGSETLTYGDYVRLRASERTLEPPSAAEADEALSVYRRFLGANGAPADAIALWLGASMSACQEARPASGRFPVVLIAAGNGGAAPDQALLAEYLASHGYVVATSPSQARLGDAVTSERDILPSALAQSRDLACVVSRLRSFDNATGGAVGVVGYSFGGRSALLFAGREPRVAAMVSLDSGIGSRNGRGWLPRGRLAGLSIRAPILHVFEDADDFMAPDLAFVAGLAASDRLFVRVADLGHFEFTTYGMASAVIPGLNPLAAGRRLDEKVDAVFRYVRAFLDAAIKGDAGGRAFLVRSPGENRLPAELLTTFRMAAGAR
jgi:dienelactone hydrolase